MSAPPLSYLVAVDLAAGADGIVVPHDRYLYLNEAATADIYSGALNPLDVDDSHCDEAGPNGFGNVVVFSRATWQQAGRFDERFGMWGGDDAAFAYAADALVAPPRRLPGNVIHLHHPRLPQSIPGDPGYQRQFAILAEYRDAATPQAIRDLIRRR